jgi:DNA polymerase elongation subunit (family B)
VLLEEEVFAHARVQLEELRRGAVPPRMLAILHRISHPPEEYRTNLPVALAARELVARGVHLAPGESVEYVLTLGGGARPYDAWRASDCIDVARYRELFLRMLESLAVPAGYDRAGIVAKLEGIGQDELPGMPHRSDWWKARLSEEGLPVSDFNISVKGEVEEAIRR